MDQTKENLDFEREAQALADRALFVIRERFENVPLSKRLFYHNTVHTLGVIQRAVEIAQAMCLSVRHVVMTKIIAAFHDTKQAWYWTEKGDGIVVRARYAGQNELSSLGEMTEAMNEYPPSSPVRLTPEEYGIAASAFVATIPSWSVEHGTVIQPFLTPCSHPVARAVALADLGSAGMDPASFVKEGPALFAEDQIDLMMALIFVKQPSGINAMTQESYRERYLTWLESQAKFARGRQALLGKELKGLSASAADRVKALFNRFDESIELAAAAVAKAKSEDFVTLMRQLLPTAFSEEGK